MAQCALVRKKYLTLKKMKKKIVKLPFGMTIVELYSQHLQKVKNLILSQHFACLINLNNYNNCHHYSLSVFLLQHSTFLKSGIFHLRSNPQIKRKEITVNRFTSYIAIKYFNYGLFFSSHFQLFCCLFFAL